MSKFLYDNNFLYRGTRHILFFVLTVLIFTGLLYLQQDGVHQFSLTLRETIVNALFFFGYAYITIFLLIPEFLLKRKALWFILLFVLIGIGLSTIKMYVSETIFYASVAPENMSKKGIMSMRYIVINTKDMSFIVALFCIAKYVKDYLYTENVRKLLESQNKEAQGKLLQSQFDPHFLFNTINNLYALSLLNPLKTREVIKRMKIVLEYIITESQKDFVWLEDEISLVDNYIQLESLRYGKRLKVSFDKGEDKGEIVEKIKVPPMVLFFLVENCFKHGSSLDAGVPWIKISVNTKSDKIILSTENSKPKSVLKDKEDVVSGTGYKNLKKRLNIVYGKQGFFLNIESTDNSFKVDLELNKGIEFSQHTYR